MPYIDQRYKYDPLIDQLVEKLISDKFHVGHLNYVISKIVWTLWNKLPSGANYTNGNNLIGVLECVKQEFYRRKLASYEDIQINKNGDLTIDPSEQS